MRWATNYPNESVVSPFPPYLLRIVETAHPLNLTQTYKVLITKRFNLTHSNTITTLSSWNKCRSDVYAVPWSGQARSSHSHPLIEQPTVHEELTSPPSSNALKQRVIRASKQRNREYQEQHSTTSSRLHALAVLTVAIAERSPVTKLTNSACLTLWTFACKQTGNVVETISLTTGYRIENVDIGYSYRFSYISPLIFLACSRQIGQTHWFS